MTATEAFARLRSLDRAALRTREVAAILMVPDSTALSTLKRLEAAGLAFQIKQGLWAVGREPDGQRLPVYLTAPFPSYISFESALFQHGMIEQIPPRITAASLGPARQIKTNVGTFDVRHLQPSLFGGFESDGDLALATREKALVDLVYLAAERGWKSAHFPEIEIPGDVDIDVIEAWVKRIPSAKLKTMVARILSGLGVRVVEAKQSA